MKEETKPCIVNVDEETKEYIQALKKELGLKNSKDVIRLLVEVTENYRIRPLPSKENDAILVDTDILPIYVKEMNLSLMKGLQPKPEKTPRKAVSVQSEAIPEDEEEPEIPEEEDEFETVVEVGV